MKSYKFKLKNTKQVWWILAKNNREAMKQVGGWVSKYGEILWLKDDKGKLIIYNKK